ncbi:hypothetical protein RJ639_018033 [Escallonia herrerae]|uniref:Uncharacterized protein n=1 Tax=Escallonia herrerae TaxID=1293975 RepID=A0AA88VBB0_9ASTE|nr:hypothetical protein RJ639_018033 [Escallonia herrerae]
MIDRTTRRSHPTVTYAAMATTRSDLHCPQTEPTTEEEQVEREIDVNEVSKLCSEHARGTSALGCVDEHKPTSDRNIVDDGSADVAECRGTSQQTDHFKCFHIQQLAGNNE